MPRASRILEISQSDLKYTARPVLPSEISRELAKSGKSRLMSLFPSVRSTLRNLLASSRSSAACFEGCFNVPSEGTSQLKTGTEVKQQERQKGYASNAHLALQGLLVPFNILFHVLLTPLIIC